MKWPLRKCAPPRNLKGLWFKSCPRNQTEKSRRIKLLVAPSDQRERLRICARGTSRVPPKRLLFVQLSSRRGRAPDRQAHWRCNTRAISGSLSPHPSDPTYDPYYKLCIEAGIPVLIFVGTTGLGAGRLEAGAILDHCHPRQLRLGSPNDPPQWGPHPSGSLQPPAADSRRALSRRFHSPSWNDASRCAHARDCENCRPPLPPFFAPGSHPTSLAGSVARRLLVGVRVATEQFH